MFGFSRRDKPNSEEFRYSERNFNALIGGAMGLSHELETLILQGRQKAQQPGENGMQQSDILSLIDRLKDVASKVVTEIETQKRASTEKGEVVFDAAGHSRYVAPSANLLVAPDAAVNAAVEAVNRGATNADLIYGFILAEIDAPLQRWRVALAAGIAERQA